jgi:hypothetical protein
VFTCSLCRDVVPLDDTLVATAKGTCICLRCYLRTVEDGRRLPSDLGRQVAEAAATA